METDAHGASLGGGAGLASRALGFAGPAGGGWGGLGEPGTPRQGLRGAGHRQAGRSDQGEPWNRSRRGGRGVQWGPAPPGRVQVQGGLRCVGPRWGAVSRPAQRLCVHTVSGWALPFPWRPAPPFWAWLQHRGDPSRTPTLRGPRSMSSPREWGVATVTDTGHPGETLAPEPPEEAGLCAGYPREDTVSLVCPLRPHLSARRGCGRRVGIAPGSPEPQAPESRPQRLRAGSRLSLWHRGSAPPPSRWLLRA